MALMLKVLVGALLGLVLVGCSAEDDAPAAAATFSDFAQAHSARDVEEAYCSYYARCVPLADYLHCIALAQQLSDDATGVDQDDAATCMHWAGTAACDAPLDCPLF